jgi:hypothetical protein
VNRSFTGVSGKVFFKDSSTNTGEGIILSRNGERYKNNIWAETSIIGALQENFEPRLAPLDLFNSGVASLPMEEGDYIVVRSDGTDSDGDGVPGIENNETVILYSTLNRDIDGAKTLEQRVAWFSVVNDTARIYKWQTWDVDGKPDEFREWRPCDLEDEINCKTLSTYNYR